MDPVGAKLLEVAKKELGYQEKAGGYTKYGEWYGKTHEGGDSYFTTAPWCDMFLAWAADKAGVTDWAGEFAATIQHAKWFKEKDAWGTEPEPGAMVFFAWSGSDDIDAISHVGLVESVEGSTLRTIEANTDGVHLKRRTRDVGDVVGYGYPGEVEVAGKSIPGAAPAQAAEENAVPKHAAPAVDSAETPRTINTVTSRGTAPTPADHPTVPPEALLGTLLSIALCGTVALGVGKAAAAKVPAEAPVRVRKRGKHHKRPVTLPADVTPADLDASDAGTAVMPALSAAAAAEAEDREFWSRVSALQDDEELAFWDSLLADLPRIPSNTSGRAAADRS